jgi:outer membrane protein TolC
MITHKYICLLFLLPAAVSAVFLISGQAEAETLEQAWECALKDNSGYKASQIATEALSSAVDAAKSVRMPSVDAKAGYTQMDEEQALDANLFGQHAEVPLMEEGSASYSVMASVPVYTGGSIEKSISAAKETYNASKEQEDGYAQNLKIRVAEAYVNVLRAESFLKQAKSHVKNLEAHAYDVESLYLGGMVIVSDQLSAQVALADARQKELQADNAVDLAKAAYNRLLMRPLEQEVFLDEVETGNGAEREPLDNLTARALDTRRELKTLDHQIQALRYQAGAIRGGRLPQVGLAGGYNYQENKYQVHEDQWVAMLEVRMNLFDGSKIKNQASSVEQQALALKAQRSEFATAVALQVRQAWLDVEETQKRIKVTEAAINLAEKNLQVVRDRYVNGFCSHTEVLDAETLRVSSRTNAVNAHYDYVISVLKMRYAVGEL